MQCLRETLTVLLCLSLSCPAVPARALPAPTSTSPTSTSPAGRPSVTRQHAQTDLGGDDRILHALNRFTFGPRPGDLDQVRRMGLDAWFEQQLHPAAIDHADLDARLADYPAMRWTPEELLFRLPSNAVIRQVMNRRELIPEHGAVHAVYEDEIFRYQQRLEKRKEEGDAAAGQKTASSTPASGTLAPTTPAPGISAPGVPSQGTPAATAGSGQMAADGKVGDAGTGSAGAADGKAREVVSPAPAGNEMGMMAMAAAPAAPVFDASAVRSILALPPDQRVSRLVSMPQPDLDAFLRTLRPQERAALNAGLTPEEREVAVALESPARVVVDELMAQHLTREIYSPAQLEEVMTDFWLNHFNVFLRKAENTPYYLVGYERDAIRPHALGRFEDLLEATAHSPAMLLYLDNAESLGPHSPAAARAARTSRRRIGLNENYARELMELHTVGVDGGYTQADVTQVARILTGWTVAQPQRGGGFTFDPNRHEPGTKVALGQRFRENGEQEGRDLLHMLATRPATARFLSRKLAIRFVSDDPPQSLVDRMTDTYLASDGDISAVLETLFHSPEFWSPEVYRAKVKTPLEFVVSAVRASDAGITNLRPLADAMRAMGMPLYGCVPPTGYRWSARDWVSTGALVDRMNFALSLAAGRVPGVTTMWNPETDNSSESMLATGTPSPESEELRLEALLVNGGISESTRAAVLEQFAQQSASGSDGVQRVAAVRPPSRNPALEHEDQLLAGLLLGSPEFQRR